MIRQVQEGRADKCDVLVGYVIYAVCDIAEQCFSSVAGNDGASFVNPQTVRWRSCRLPEYRDEDGSDPVPGGTDVAIAKAPPGLAG